MKYSITSTKWKKMAINTELVAGTRIPELLVLEKNKYIMQILTKNSKIFQCIYLAFSPNLC